MKTAVLHDGYLVARVDLDDGDNLMWMPLARHAAWTADQSKAQVFDAKDDAVEWAKRLRKYESVGGRIRIRVTTVRAKLNSPMWKQVAKW